MSRNNDQLMLIPLGNNNNRSVFPEVAKYLIGELNILLIISQACNQVIILNPFIAILTSLMLVWSPANNLSLSLLKSYLSDFIARVLLKVVGTNI